MSKHLRFALAVVASTILVAAVVGTASANRLSISTRNIRAVWPRMTFSGPFATINCPVTLEGSLHSATIVKRAEALIGFITRAAVTTAACEGSGTATILQTSLPWHVLYTGFQTSLPNITAINTRIIGAAFEVTVGPCLFVSSTTQPATGAFNREAGGVITGVTAGGEITSTTDCFLFSRVTGSLSGTSSSPTVLGTTTAISVRLI